MNHKKGTTEEPMGKSTLLPKPHETSSKPVYDVDCFEILKAGRIPLHL